MSDWQDISTAPKDEHLLLFCPRDVELKGLTISAPVVLSGYWDSIDEAWCSTTSTWQGPFFEPTHWMYLPDNPPPSEVT